MFNGWEVFKEQKLETNTWERRGQSLLNWCSWWQEMHYGARICWLHASTNLWISGNRKYSEKLWWSIWWRKGDWSFSNGHISLVQLIQRNDVRLIKRLCLRFPKICSFKWENHCWSFNSCASKMSPDQNISKSWDWNSWMDVRALRKRLMGDIHNLNWS